MNQTNFVPLCANDQPIDSTSIFSAKFRFSTGRTIFIYLIYLLPFCFGVFGNISVCLIFFQQKKLRSITNTFLMNLCKFNLFSRFNLFLFAENSIQGLNDLIVLCVSIPMTLSAALLEHWVFGAFLCKFVNFMPTLTALVSTFTVAVIAVERWFFIVNKQKFDSRCTILTLILLWFVSIVIALPEFISRQLQEFIPQTMLPMMMRNYPQLLNQTDALRNHYMFQSPCPMKKIFYCVLKPDLRMRIFSYLVITVQYLVPFLFVSVSCYSISRFLKGRMKHMRVYQTQRQQQPLQKGTRKKSSNITDEMTEAETIDCEETPINVHSIERRSNPFLARFRQTFQNSETSNGQNSLPFIDQQQYLKTQSHTKRRFHRSRKLLICVAALFTISWLPLTITQIYLEHNEEILYTRDGANFVYGYLLIPCYLVSSLSAWINPIIYNYINRSFRREFYALYSCCLPVSSPLLNPTAGKEMTSADPKRIRRTTNQSDVVRLSSPRGSTVKSTVPAVSFAEQTTVIIHGQR